MYNNVFQGGPCVEVFSAQSKDALNKWKLTGSGIKKIMDKEVKSFVCSLEGSTVATKMQLPKDARQNLMLLQGILVLQISIPQGQDFVLDIGVFDLSNQRRRLAFSTTHKEFQINPLHAKIPLGLIKRVVWLNLCIDLRTLVADLWKGMTFKTLESICIAGNCRLRRILTMRNQPLDTTDDDVLYGIPDTNTDVGLESIPKHCQLSADVLQQTQVINSTKLRHYEAKCKGVELSVTRTNSTPDPDPSSQPDCPGACHIAFGSKVRRTVSAKDAILVGRTSSRPNSGNRPELQSSRTWTDGVSSDKNGIAVEPHPPRKPSSQKSRRIRVKSTGQEGSVQAGMSDAASSENGSNQNIAIENNPEKTEYDSLYSDDPGDLDDPVDPGSEESTNEVVTSRKNETRPKNHSNKVYLFSSRPREARTGNKESSSKKYSAPLPMPDRHGPSSDRLSADSFDDDCVYGREFMNSRLSHVKSPEPKTKHKNNGSHLKSNNLYPHSIANGSTVNSPRRQSINRKSLREIPVDELRRSGGTKPYTSAKYQTDNNVMDSFERQMLLSMQRENDTEGEEEDEDSENKSGSNFQLGEDTFTDFSDDDMSTLKSPKLHQINKSHNYQDEIKNLGHGFLTQSNPREWRDAFSPPTTMTNGTISAPVSDIPKTNDDTDEELDLFYDSELHYFYDPQTCKYYELITPGVEH